MLLLTAGCGIFHIFPEKVSVNDPRVKTLLEAASKFDRAQYGFSPLPTTGDVLLESRPRANYDAMLHISEKANRTIAFRRRSDQYEWIHEQETFEGPNEYKSADGTYREQVCLIFEIEHVSGVPLYRLNVDYVGDDHRLADRHNLSLADVKPILKEWGY